MKAQKGLSAVELVVALVVASMFLIAGYQIYTYIFRDGTQTAQAAEANNLAYAYMRKKAASLPSQTICTTSTETATPPTTTKLIIVSISTVVDCPYSAVGSPQNTVSRVTTTVTYKDAQGNQTVSHALLKS